jgi:hypothetical protein
MRLVSRGIIASAILSLVCAIVGAGTEDPLLKDIASYRDWTKVTPAPIPVYFPSGGG